MILFPSHPHKVWPSSSFVLRSLFKNMKENAMLKPQATWCVYVPRGQLRCLQCCRSAVTVAARVWLSVRRKARGKARKFSSWYDFLRLRIERSKTALINKWLRSCSCERYSFKLSRVYSKTGKFFLKVLFKGFYQKNCLLEVLGKVKTGNKNVKEPQL